MAGPPPQPPKVVYKPRAKPGSLPPRRKASKLVISGAIVGFVVLLFALLDQVKERFYIFDVDRLRQVQLQSLERHGNDTRAVIDDIIGTLRKEQPSWAISPKEEWFFNNAGGAMGSMHIIHASLTEYLIIFGTAVGTEGHSGRHTADDYFHILHGVQTAYRAGALVPEVYPAGSMHLMRRGEVKQYAFTPQGWAMEYARGLIPPMMLFGLADAATSTVDFGTAYDTVRITAREMIRNLLHGKL